MRNSQRMVSTLTLVALFGLLWVSCSDVSGPAAPESPGLTECGAGNVFRARDFVNPTRVDNRFFPLDPGSQFILDGVATRSGVILNHRVVFTVTDLTKVMNGVETVVLWDRDYNNGQLQEAELAFFAQDKTGGVWVLGEYPEEYDNGAFVGAPNTWISGLSGADAGNILPGDLQIGRAFLQGWSPDINFLDCGRVFSVGEGTCVPYNCYENVLVVDEWSPLDPGSGHQRKYYAPGVGNVRIGAVDDPEGETLVLVNILQLTPEELAEARVETLKLEERAYQVNDDYRRTERAHLR